MIIFGDLVEKIIGGFFYTKISVSINTDGYKKVLGVTLIRWIILHITFFLVLEMG
ncbi:hypothetical protein BDA96_01G550400 [Sorghum bicolor]|jgi:hypothetical protein|uniref:Uncharacterized protein n=2 Tax=Sorghum bicolor TaxID=4558 RepID=A0A1Z5SBK2_SORBI|nr:hypothetical protein BDA96_01G550400 [Sorghum bicolor]OQU93300.1 hypothetical protein SORBI_3001G515350 [Sorghum bicolor]